MNSTPDPPAVANAEVGLSPSETTMAQHLKSAGYATGLVGKWHLGHVEKFHPQSRGFDEFFGFLGGAHAYNPAPNRRAAGPNPIMRGRDAVDESEYLTDALRREAVQFVDRHKAEPFFLYLAFNAVHTPLQAPPKYRDRFPGILDERRRTYAAMMSAMDDAIGAVLAKLKESGLEEHTLVFFISDNGGPPGNASNNRPLRGHKASTWEGGIRVPFLLSWKGRLPAGKTYDHPVAQIDILPTALAAAGVETKPEWQMDGVDLVPHLIGTNASPPHSALYWRFGQQMAIRSGDWKLVKGRIGNGVAAANAGNLPVQLFNLSADASEQNDLSTKDPAKVKELEAHWKKWDAELKPPAWGPPVRARQQARRRAATGN